MTKMGFEKDRVVQKMGFEPKQRLVTTGYGRGEHVEFHGKRLWTASEAERKWLRELDLCIEGGEVEAWEWQPGPYPVEYRNKGTACSRTYQPDCRVVWAGGEEIFYEIKCGRIEGKAKTNIIAFCKAGYKLVLVWVGPMRKKGIHARRLDDLRHLIDHVWHIK